MKKYVLEEITSGGDVAEPFEAEDYESAAKQVLENMGYRLREVKDGILSNVVYENIFKRRSP